MTTHRSLPIALWLPALAVGVALVASFLVFVWPTPYKYYTGYLEQTPFYHRVNRFTGRSSIRFQPTAPWRELDGK